MYYYLVFLGLILSLKLNGQNLIVNSARSVALSGITVTVTDAWSGINNQAGLAFHPNKAVAINSNNRFMVPELSSQTINASVPAGVGAMAYSFSFFGDRQYHEEHLSFAYGRVLPGWLGAGIGLNYHRSSVEVTDRHTGKVSADIGIIAIPTDGWRIGLQVNNPSRICFKNSLNEDCFSGVRFGISYSEEESFLVGSQIDWDNYKQLNVRMGAECLLMKSLFIRIGIKIPCNTSYSFGTGIQLKRMDIDLGFEQHPCLGLSSSLSWIIKLNKNEK